jgi:hypothetical protein
MDVSAVVVEHLMARQLKMDDFAERSEAHAKRCGALVQAISLEREISALLNTGTGALVVLAIVAVWPSLDAKALVIIAVSALCVRWIAKVLVRVLWTNPTIRRIDRETPAPPLRHSIVEEIRRDREIAELLEKAGVRPKSPTTTDRRNT